MKILFIHKQDATFIQNDLKILQKHYEVTDFKFSLKRIPELIKEIKNCDLIFVWFVSYFAYIVTQINRLYSKPLIIIAGGYGVQSDVLKKHKIFKLMVKSSLKRASEILAVSKFTQKEVAKIDWYTYCRVVYNGIDTTLFRDYKLRDSKTNMALTVGNIFSMERYYLKGIDRFVELARKTPATHFYVIGMSDEIAEKLKDIPSNCHFILPMAQRALVFFYNMASTYYQLSKYESFCLTLLEARACGCKVVTSTDTGMDEIQGMFVEELTLEKREKKLVEILNEYRK